MRIYLVYSDVCAYVPVSFIATYGLQSEHVGLQKVLLFDVRPVKNKKVDPLTEAVYGELDGDEKIEYGMEQEAKRRRAGGTVAGRIKGKGKFS